MDKYPKIETLFDRDPNTFNVVEGQFRCPEFDAVKRWSVTEKIDGTNVRIYFGDDGHVEIAGRTDNASLHPKLMAHLCTFAMPERLREIFPDGRALLFGEGYGPKIQKGGERYRDTQGFRLFDVICGGMWLKQEAVRDVAEKLGVPTVPQLGIWLLDDAVELARITLLSLAARADGGDTSYAAEGIVARSEPLMFDRRGNRIMWKLKYKDFPR